MQGSFFNTTDDVYHVASYFYRIEFQQRGAPHVHALLWLKNQAGKDAPNFWFDSEGLQEEELATAEEERIKEMEQNIWD